MTEQEKDLIVDLSLERVSRSDFLRQYKIDENDPSKKVEELLRAAKQSRDAEAVECALSLGFIFGYTSILVPILVELLEEDWHVSHEDIAMMFQDLEDPRCVDVLYRTAEARFEYLDFDEAYALGVKCIWALGAIGTPEAWEKLESLKKSENSIIRENAFYQFQLAEEEGRPTG